MRLVRIVLHGLAGPLSAKGKTYYLDMLAFGSLPDEQISAVLTYLRLEWEHTGGARGACHREGPPRRHRRPQRGLAAGSGARDSLNCHLP
ncbi:hypothetical protein [Prosthecobacter sp.]|uniref:hypothetical protein n=1 Tax=Prosthecobacter sp. TaxID=1965333 RepID=UPI003783C2F0